MATTNRKAKPQPSSFTHEGSVAKRITPVQELTRSVLSCMLWENTFYEDGKSVADRISELCSRVSPKTLSDLAIMARSQYHLRHVPLLLTVELAKHGGPIVSKTIEKVIQRPDEMAEFLSIYWKNGRCPLSSQIKKGLALAFNKFDEYQLAKYNRDNAIALRDVMFLCHVKPVAKTKGKLVAAIKTSKYKRGKVLRHKSALTTKLAEDTLKTPDTHEAASGAGDDRPETFRRLMAEGKLGGMAFIKNLRFLNDNGFTKKELAEYGATVNLSKILPFRFISAARAVPALEDIIEPMMLRALGDAEKLPGKTAILVDNSGSMYGTKVSEKSDIDRSDAACAVAILVSEICEDKVVISFGSNAKVVPNRKGFALADAIKSVQNRQSTDTHAAVALANSLGYDRIIVITDEQSHTQVGNPKRNSTGYFINVSIHKNGIGYGAWNHIDGFSEAVVDWIRQFERHASNEQE